MPEPNAPGVYIEEIDSGTHPIQGVSTTIGKVAVAVVGLAITVAAASIIRRRLRGIDPRARRWHGRRY